MSPFLHLLARKKTHAGGWPCDQEPSSICRLAMPPMRPIDTFLACMPALRSNPLIWPWSGPKPLPF